jgi:hypothetical protein
MFFLVLRVAIHKPGKPKQAMPGDCYAFSQMTAFSKVTHLIWLLFTQTFYALGDIEYMTIQKNTCTGIRKPFYFHIRCSRSLPPPAVALHRVAFPTRSLLPALAPPRARYRSPSLLSLPRTRSSRACSHPHARDPKRSHTHLLAPPPCALQPAIAPAPRTLSSVLASPALALTPRSLPLPLVPPRARSPPQALPSPTLVPPRTRSAGARG